MSITLAEQRARLEARLHDGWNRIGQAEDEGRDVRSWESLWYGILAEYESACRHIDGQMPRTISLSSTPVDTPCGNGDPIGVEQRADQRSLLLGGF